MNDEMKGGTLAKESRLEEISYLGRRRFNAACRVPNRCAGERDPTPSQIVPTCSLRISRLKVPPPRRSESPSIHGN
jgi:hypothetical protein